MPASKTEKKSGWSIGDFYNQAWDLTWNNKKLWILGLAVSIYAAGGGGGGGGNSFDTNSLQNLQNNQPQQQQELPESPYSNLTDDEGAQELAESPEAVSPEAVLQEKNDTVMAMFQPFLDGFNQVPGSVLALLVLEGIVIGFAAIALSFFLAAWSQGALIQGVADAADEKKINLFTISSHAITRAKSMVWLMIVPGLKFFLTVLVLAIGGAIVLAIVGSVVPDASPILVLVGIAAVIWFFYAVIRLAVALIYAARYCVLENLSGSEAFAAGDVLAKGNLWKTIRLGAANGIMAMLIGVIIMIPIIGVGAATVMRDLFRESVTAWTFVPVGLTAMVAMPAMFLVGGIIKVFVFSTWHFAYQALRQHS